MKTSQFGGSFPRSSYRNPRRLVYNKPSGDEEGEVFLLTTSLKALAMGKLPLVELPGSTMIKLVTLREDPDPTARPFPEK